MQGLARSEEAHLSGAARGVQFTQIPENVIVAVPDALCFTEFMEKGFGHLLNGTYEGAYQNQKKAAFLQNLGG